MIPASVWLSTNFNLRATSLRHRRFEGNHHDIDGPATKRIKKPEVRYLNEGVEKKRFVTERSLKKTGDTLEFITRVNPQIIAKNLSDRGLIKIMQLSRHFRKHLLPHARSRLNYSISTLASWSDTKRTARRIHIDLEISTHRLSTKVGHILLPLERITHISFFSDYPHIIYDLPSSITHMRFGHNYNQPVDFLPESLKFLQFGNNFNQPVDHLPLSLKHLSFGHNFNQSLSELPEGLECITLGSNFYDDVSEVPDSTTHLNIHSGHLPPGSIDELPIGLTHLCFSNYSGCMDNLPDSVTHLVLAYGFNGVLNKLPPNLIYLRLGYEYNQPLSSLPSKLQQLVLGESFRNTITDIPKSLRNIQCSVTYRRTDLLPFLPDVLVEYYYPRRNRNYCYWANTSDCWRLSGRYEDRLDDDMDEE